MTRRVALVCGCNYSGAWRTFQSEADASKVADCLRHKFAFDSVTLCLGEQACTRNNLLKRLRLLVSQLSDKDCVGVVYVAGHGTQTSDANRDEEDGRDEAWQTGDRQLLTDDEITNCLCDAHPGARVVVISDTCHSGTMIDFGARTEDRLWCSIGAALDCQSALQSGDGGAMTTPLLEILCNSGTKSFTYKQLRQLLDSKMRRSFVGALQQSVLRCSSLQMEDKIVFD